MKSSPGLRNGFPFHIAEFNELGLPFAEWDGLTYFNGLPSGSSTQKVTVVGQGTERPLSFTGPQLAKLYYVHETYRADWSLSGDVSGHSYDISISEGDQRPLAEYRQTREYEHTGTNMRKTSTLSPEDGREHLLFNPTFKEGFTLSGGLGHSSDSIASAVTVSNDEVRYRTYSDPTLSAWGSWTQYAPYDDSPSPARTPNFIFRIGTGSNPHPGNLVTVKIGDTYWPLLTLSFDHLSSVRVQTEEMDPTTEEMETITAKPVATVTATFLGQTIDLFSTDFAAKDFHSGFFTELAGFVEWTYTITGTITIAEVACWTWDGMFNSDGTPAT
jgi:hypothetical protein